MLVIASLADAASLVGQHLGYSDYLEVTQERVNLFSDATGDHQWIHVDVDRATKGPFGGPIAHGYLTLSLGPELLHDVVTWQKIRMGVNYGLNKVRFPGPLKVGARYRGFAEVTSVTEIKGGFEVHLKATLEVETAERPAVAAESIVRFYA